VAGAIKMKIIPRATYRLQFKREFTFQKAAGILDYLDDLGISDIYASPLLAATPESTHGYDTCCFDKINPNIGRPEDFENFAASLKKRGLGLLLDLVPNHMSATLSNPWWFDVLENGRESPWAQFFDIDWRPRNSATQDKVLLPVLEDHYGRVLESGRLRLTFEAGKFFIAYHDRNFPVNRTSLPPGALDNPKAVLTECKGTPGNPNSFDNLDALIQRQHYRLAWWRVASEEIDYRRFFDVTEMVALKMELPEVFNETHKLIFEWLNSGKITGLRIDHPDGLWDPKQYLQRLQREEQPVYVVVEKILSGAEQLPEDWPVDGTTGYDFLNRVNGLFVNCGNAVVFDEIYREFTGNDTDFSDIVNISRKRVLDRSFASELNSLAFRLRDIAAQTRNGCDLTLSQSRAALAEIIASFPVYRTYITENSAGVSAQDRDVIQKAVRDGKERAGSSSDFAAFEFIEQILSQDPPHGMERAREFVMKFQQLTGPAMAKGLEDTAFYQFDRLISLNEVGGDPGKFGFTTAEFHEANNATAMRWPRTMLTTGTHDTKRGEDVRARLNVLSEMPDEWRETAMRWSRLNSESKTIVGGTPAPDANDEYLLYQTLVGAWPHDAGRPDGLKQFRSRVAEFMLKAAKEAKIHTNWTEPDTEYEEALQDFIARVLADSGNEIFCRDTVRFAQRISFFGRFNSLSQTLLKVTSPGVPDVYQGSELWDLNLVDPDNRRPVDYAVRRKLLTDLKSKFESGQNNGTELLAELLRDDEPGAVKLFLIWRALNFRKRQPELFEQGNYAPVSALGEKREHVCAFMRTLSEKKIVVVVPRLVFGLTQGVELAPMGAEVWRDTVLVLPLALRGCVFRNVLTDKTVAGVERDGSLVLEVGEALKTFPVALLETL
jgi:(1->4)-alpha-D-glucan 1-alpha-D-glucosylmutase